MKKLLLMLCLTMLLITPVYADVISVAKMEIGKGEALIDNGGADVFKYTKGRKAPWCAAFISYVLNKAGNNKLVYSLSSIDIYKQAKSKGMLLSKPVPGCLFVTYRGKRQPLVTGHIGLVIDVTGGYITTIEGNTGKFPSKVKIIKYRDNIPGLISYINIA